MASHILLYPSLSDAQGAFTARCATTFEIYSVSTIRRFTGCHAQYDAFQASNTGRTPSLVNRCTVFLFYVRYTTYGTDGFTSYPKDEASQSVLLKDTGFMLWLEPTLCCTEGKKQSLSSVLLTARTRRKEKICICFYP